MIKNVKKNFSFLLHEYQAQRLLKQNNINIPKGEVIFSEKDIEKALSKLSGNVFAVKAQVHTGGRGLGYFKENNFKGGVKIVKSREEIPSIARNMLGNTLITKQTGSSGIKCNALYIVEGLSIINERYLSITLDRKHQSPVILASSEGGVNIEDIAEKNPSAIKILPIDVKTGLLKDQAIKFAKDLLFKGDEIDQAADIFLKLYKTFVEKDCLMIEINPLVTVKNEKGKVEVVVADSKVSIDENANFRQKDIEEMVDNSNQNEIEKEAISYGLNFIRLDGSIGCLVNGAGLAMATMDIIKLHNGSPANFLDVGGGADIEGMVQALRILNKDNQVKSILVNIFGGILRCDDLVNAIIKGTTEYNLRKPIVLRLKGTNSFEARELIKKSNFSHIEFCDDLDLATKLAVNVSKKI